LSSQIINTLLVVGLLGGAVVAYLKRCEWFQVCGADPISDAINQVQQAVGSVSSDLSDEAKKLLERSSDPKQVVADIKASGDDKRIQQAVQVSQTPLKPIINTAPGNTLSPAVKNFVADESCHFSQACASKGGLVRIWRGTGADPCIPCGKSAYARANLAELTLYGGRMSYN
jgi:hypothetical protein